MLIYTAVFILCEAPIWLIYFMYNCEEGAKWIFTDQGNEFHYGMFYHKYIYNVLKNDFSYHGINLHIALLYYPMYIQLVLTIETFIQTITLLFVQHDVLHWLYNTMTKRNILKSLQKKPEWEIDEDRGPAVVVGETDC
eukprot:sb/3474459/